MKFSEVVAQTLAWLQREERISYRALKREFDLDDETLEDLKAELIEVKELAVDKDGRMLVWVGAATVASSQLPVASSPQPPAAERRQLTVLFCDLVGSTALSMRLDPEDLREVVRAYQQTCATVIQQHEGHIAQYLGDGLLVYFGYPVAHEDDARRAVRAGLETISALREQVPSSLVGEKQSGETADAHDRSPLQVRIGIHTGLVVVGDIGVEGQSERLALGETPNIAARIQALAEPDTVMVSAATQRLLEGHFESQPFGSHLLKGIETPLVVYRVQSERPGISPLAGRTTLTSLVGREQEVGLLIDRWEQAKEGRGQVVFLSGEPGIGKSRLALTLKEHISREGASLFEARCSSYHQHSALYPLIESFQRTLLLTQRDSDKEKTAKLERALALYEMQDALPLFTALLSLPTPPQYPPLTLTPQKQKERTLQVALQWLVAQAERHPTVAVWEDLHWADPSSLEFLALLVEQIPTTKLLVVLTFRPEFTPSWKLRSHVTQLTLNRLGRKQIEVMIAQVARESVLPSEVVEQILVKTDGVPLFVEELTKSVIEAGLEAGAQNHESLPLHIPATLQEALMARLDRLSTARQVAQLGATLGREFSYDLLHTVAPLSETDLHAALAKLVEAEILYQRGLSEQARYVFKHALIQDIAYQSLLKSTRKQYHQQIVRSLEEHFPDTKEGQPELLAHHCIEAGLIAQAIPYCQKAGETAMQRLAYVEAANYCTRSLALLQTLPETEERNRQEVRVQIMLGNALMMSKGVSAPEVGLALTRAQTLCQQLADPVQLFAVHAGLRMHWDVRGEARKALAQAEQMMQIAQQVQDSGFLLEAYFQLGLSSFVTGELTVALQHFEQGVAMYDPSQHRALTVQYGIDPKIGCLGTSGAVLWLLGYPDQALRRRQETLTFARELSHPPSVVLALTMASWVQIFRQEEEKTLEPLAEAISLCAEYGIPTHLALSKLLQGRVLLRQGNQEEGLRQIQEVFSFMTAMEASIFWSQFLAYQAEGHAELGQTEIGLSLLSEALDFVEKNDERYYEAELYRLKGALTLQQFNVQGSTFNIDNPQSTIRNPQLEAEACFVKAIEIARKQNAKSLELRATTNLARLWQQQDKKAEACKLLANVYHWFTEGFDTKDLQEVKALIEELHQ